MLGMVEPSLGCLSVWSLKDIPFRGLLSTPNATSKLYNLLLSLFPTSTSLCVVFKFLEFIASSVQFFFLRRHLHHSTSDVLCIFALSALSFLLVPHSCHTCIDLYFFLSMALQFLDITFP